jgi:hypothetical protein
MRVPHERLRGAVTNRTDEWPESALRVGSVVICVMRRRVEVTILSSTFDRSLRVCSPSPSVRAWRRAEMCTWQFLEKEIPCGPS